MTMIQFPFNPPALPKERMEYWAIEDEKGELSTGFDGLPSLFSTEAEAFEYVDIVFPRIDKDRPNHEVLGVKIFKVTIQRVEE